MNSIKLNAVSLILTGIMLSISSCATVTPLHRAAFQGQTEKARLLLENGADVNAKGSFRATPLDLAFHHTETANLIKNWSPQGNQQPARATVFKKTTVGSIHQFNPASRSVVIRMKAPVIKQGETLYVETSSGEKSIRVKRVMHTRANGRLVGSGSSSVKEGARVYRKEK